MIDRDDDDAQREDFEVALALLRQAAVMDHGPARDRLIALAIKLDPDALVPPPRPH